MLQQGRLREAIPGTRANLWRKDSNAATVVLLSELNPLRQHRRAAAANFSSDNERGGRKQHCQRGNQYDRAFLG